MIGTLLATYYRRCYKCYIILRCLSCLRAVCLAHQFGDGILRAPGHEAHSPLPLVYHYIQILDRLLFRKELRLLRSIVPRTHGSRALLMLNLAQMGDIASFTLEKGQNRLVFQLLLVSRRLILLLIVCLFGENGIEDVFGHA